MWCVDIITKNKKKQKREREENGVAITRKQKQLAKRSVQQNERKEKLIQFQMAEYAAAAAATTFNVHL